MERGFDRVLFDTGQIDRTVKIYAKANQCAAFKSIEVGESVLLTDTLGPDALRIHAIDANHSPGSLMLLVEVVPKTDLSILKSAVLYTGDIRADPAWIQNLKTVSALAPYIGGSERPSERTLDKIYLDTAGALSQKEVLSVKDSIARTIALMKKFPPTTKFFINAWTTGYERFLERIAIDFRCKIHVDRYKWKMYEIIFGRERRDFLFTRSSKVRMHACERAWKCDDTWALGRGAYEFTDAEQRQMEPRGGEKRKRNAGCGCSHGDLSCAGFQACEQPADDEGHIVYVNPAEPFSVERYEKYEASYKIRLATCFERSKSGSAQWPDHLILPFSRHSALPELRQFVALFKPKSLFPNTMYDQDAFLDYFLMAKSFEGCLAIGAEQTIFEEASKYAAKALSKPKRHSRSDANEIYAKVHPYFPPAEAEIAKFRNAMSKQSDTAQAGVERLAGPEEVRLEIAAALDGADEMRPELDHRSASNALDSTGRELVDQISMTADQTPRTPQRKTAIDVREVQTSGSSRRKRQKLHNDTPQRVYSLDSDDSDDNKGIPTPGKVTKVLEMEESSMINQRAGQSSPLREMSLGSPTKSAVRSSRSLRKHPSKHILHSLNRPPSRTSNGTAVEELRSAVKLQHSLLAAFRSLPDLAEQVANNPV